MDSHSKISLPVMRRLPKYYRYVSEMINSGKTKVSSSELAKIMGTTASQVRQDFNCFGGFGQQGIGYSTQFLYDELEKLLFKNHQLDTVLIGIGSLGQAITKWITAKNRGINITAIFDVDPNMIGINICGIPIYDISKIDEFFKNNKAETAILCIPTESAKKITPVLLEHGIKNFWNFSHYDISLENPDVIVENAHLADSLMTLSFRANNE